MLSGTLNPLWRESISDLPQSWIKILEPLLSSKEFSEFADWLDSRRQNGAVIFPYDPFRALRLIEADSVKVLILGQDPYHGPSQANGLAFSVPDALPRPPSLRNILNEVAREYHVDAKRLGNDLSTWVEQGVLLLNTTLTVEQGKPASHSNSYWSAITDALVAYLAASAQPKAFLLWGAHAQNKVIKINSTSSHLILQANHPSPLSANRPPLPFVGCGHFSKVNYWLEAQGQAPIQWVTLAPDLFS